MPSSDNSAAGPMPERIRNAGECSAPMLTITSRASMSRVSPRRRTRTPVMRVPSNSNPSARVAQNVSKFGPLSDFRRQIGHGGGDTVVVDVADRDREIAVGEHAVLINDVVPAVVLHRLEHTAH